MDEKNALASSIAACPSSRNGSSPMPRDSPSSPSAIALLPGVRTWLREPTDSASHAVPGRPSFRSATTGSSSTASRARCEEWVSPPADATDQAEPSRPASPPPPDGRREDAGMGATGSLATGDPLSSATALRGPDAAARVDAGAMLVAAGRPTGVAGPDPPPSPEASPPSASSPSSATVPIWPWSNDARGSESPAPKAGGPAALPGTRVLLEPAPRPAGPEAAAPPPLAL
mmetsp:Transcript_3115/g.12815  ORF Transcript_3115/g.12815 Transcript_3115/m.12815 type:complete len:230 (-) Transcript_3115:1488-2177(-)